MSARSVAPSITHVALDRCGTHVRRLPGSGPRSPAGGARLTGARRTDPAGSSPPNRVTVSAAITTEVPATVRTYPPDVKYLAHYQEAEAAAQAAGRGIWAAAASASENCAPSYPSVCTPPPPPDLDCGEISFRRFPVTGTDPHRFDGDRDGIGCES